MMSVDGQQDLGLVAPGIVGRLVRLALGGMILWSAYGVIVSSPTWFAGDIDHRAPMFWVMMAVLTLFTGWILGELIMRDIGRWPGLVLAAIALVLALVGIMMEGTPATPLFGVFVWAWQLGFALLLGPAFLLAAVLGTPGCEMRSYAHLVRRLRGGDVTSIACKGWIDRFDGIRVLGRW